MLAAAVGGDERAFSRLWRDLNPVLRRYLVAFAPVVADDVASETWLAVVGRLGRFKGDEAGFRSWVFTIARSKVVDAWRAQGRHRVQSVADLEEVAGPAGVDTADAAVESMSTQAAMRLIGTLPRDQAEVVVLRVIAGLDVATVAGIVGCSVGAVRVRQHRGLRRLAEILEQSAVTR